jgi:hypothetical protein
MENEHIDPPEYAFIETGITDEETDIFEREGKLTLTLGIGLRLQVGDVMKLHGKGNVLAGRVISIKEDPEGEKIELEYVAM